MASTPAPSEASHKSLAEWREETRVAMSRGELLQAYDLADRALLDYPEDRLLKDRAVLALARAGGAQQARARYDKFQLGNVRSEDQAFEVGVQSLDARIAKNEALDAAG